jgi:hypothetical protein
MSELRKGRMLERVLLLEAIVSEWKSVRKLEHALPRGVMVLDQTSEDKTERGLEYAFLQAVMASG